MPSPCIMLDKMEERNKNGQIKLNMQINFPASALPNRKSPIHAPVASRPMAQTEPSSSQPKMVWEMTLLILSASLRLSASEMAGRIMTDTELVNTVGNVMIDSSIPVRMP